MSTLLDEPTHQGSTTPAAQQLRTKMAAVRVCLSWLGTKKTLTAEQRAEAAEPFGTDVRFLSAGKRLLDISHPAFKAVTAVRGKVLAFTKSMSLSYPEPGIRLIRQDKIDEFSAKMGGYQQELAEAVENLDRHYSELKTTARQPRAAAARCHGDVPRREHHLLEGRTCLVFAPRGVRGAVLFSSPPLALRRSSRGCSRQVAQSLPPHDRRSRAISPARRRHDHQRIFSRPRPASEPIFVPFNPEGDRMAVPIAVASSVLAVVLVVVLAREIRLRRALETLLRKILALWRTHEERNLRDVGRATAGMAVPSRLRHYQRPVEVRQLQGGGRPGPA